jgi:hypothetical protein
MKALERAKETNKDRINAMIERKKAKAGIKETKVEAKVRLAGELVAKREVNNAIREEEKEVKVAAVAKAKAKAKTRKPTPVRQAMINKANAAESELGE